VVVAVDVAADAASCVVERLRLSLLRPSAPCIRSNMLDRGPTRIVATTWFVAGSIRDTLGPPLFATQTASCETAIPSGCDPTGIIAMTLFVCGSMLETVLSDGWETHTAP
jgi:hypothetical protein